LVNFVYQLEICNRGGLRPLSLFKEDVLYVV